MKTLWFRELHKYKKSDIIDQLGGGELGHKLLDKLRLSNIVHKVRDNKDKTDEVMPEELTNIVLGDSGCVTFNFVGIVMVGDYVLRCYPKYEDNGLSAAADKPSELFSVKFNNVMAAIKKYNKTRPQNKYTVDYGGDSDIFHLSIILELLQHYYKNGLYIKSQGLEELNGEGEINWNRTIHETEAIVVNKKPFYPDMYTALTQWDEMDYFHQLHRCIISECFNILKEADLKEILEQPGNLNCEKRLKDFGSTDQIVRRLKKELKVQFVTWKKAVLNLMLVYVTRLGSKRKSDKILFYGTNKMNQIWETACKQIFGDMLEKEISGLKVLDKNNREKYQKKLIDIIDKPIWAILGTDKTYAKDTLIPDTVVIKSKGDALQFNIYDAKYYHINITDRGISQQPGIESITKQYLYHKAYSQFMEEFGIMGVNNIFLVPTDGEPRKFATASLSFLSEITQKDIDAAYLNADDVWKAYVDGIEDWDLDEVINGQTEQDPAQP